MAPIRERATSCESPAKSTGFILSCARCSDEGAVHSRRIHAAGRETSSGFKHCIKKQYSQLCRVQLSPLPLVDPASLPHVWRVARISRREKAGFAHRPCRAGRALPGGGWPVGSMVEVLQERPGQHVWQLLLPALARLSHSPPGPVVLVGAPYEPFGPSLKAQGLPAERLLCVRADKAAARLWATEQALRCADVAAVLAWLPQARSRRAAPPAHGGPAAVATAVRLSRLEGPPRCFAGALAAAGGRRGHARAAHPQAPRPAAGDATGLAGSFRAAGGAARSAQKSRVRSRSRHAPADSLAQEIACTGSHCCPHMKTSAAPGAGGPCSSRPAWPRSTKPCCWRPRRSLRLWGGRKACCAGCSRNAQPLEPRAMGARPAPR